LRFSFENFQNENICLNQIIIEFIVSFLMNESHYNYIESVF